MTLVPPTFEGVVRLCLATAHFSGQRSCADTTSWIKKTYFGSFMGDNLLPHRVFVCGTADQGDNVLNALDGLKISVCPCAEERLHTAMIRPVGVSGSANTGKNPGGQKLVARGAALAEVLSHSAVNNDDMHDVQDEERAREEKREGRKSSMARMFGGEERSVDTDKERGDRGTNLAKHEDEDEDDATAAVTRTRI